MSPAAASRRTRRWPGPGGQLLQGIEHYAVGPRHCPLDPGPRVPPQALPCVPRSGAGLLRRPAEPPLVPRPGLPRGVPACCCAGQAVQGGGDIITPIAGPACWAGRNAWNTRTLTASPATTPIPTSISRGVNNNQPARQPLISSTNSAREGDRGRLACRVRRQLPITTPASMITTMPPHPRTQHHGHRDCTNTRRARNRPRTGCLAQRPGHRGGHARQRRQGSERIVLARRVPGHTQAATAASAGLAARRPRSCQYRTGPDEAGCNGAWSRDHHGPGPPRRACPITTLRWISPRYPTPQPNAPANPALTERHVSGTNPARPLERGTRPSTRLTSWPYRAQPVISASSPLGPAPVLAPELPDPWPICDPGRGGTGRHRRSMPPAHHEVAHQQTHW